MQEYIRIDEAIKKYWKTRQTFYNYINKWILEVRKINNRLFLETDAIEHLMDKTVIENNNEIPWIDVLWAHEEKISIIEKNIGEKFSDFASTICKKIDTNYQFIWQELDIIIKQQNIEDIKSNHILDKIIALDGIFLILKLLHKKVIFYITLICIYIFQYFITSIF